MDRQDGGDNHPHPNLPPSRGKGYFQGLWRDGDFLKLWASRSVSEFGMLMGALQFTAVLVLNVTPLQLGVIRALGVAPGIGIGFFAGVLADRIRRRPILIVADLGRFVLLASIPVTYLSGHLRIEYLYIVVFLQGILTTFFDIAYRSYLPTLVSSSKLVEANSKITGSESFAEVTAFSVGGWIAQLTSAVSVVAINALTFLASAVSLAFIRRGEPAAEAKKSSRSVAREIAEGFQVVWRHRLLRPLAVAAAVEGCVGGMLGAVFLVFGVNELGFGAGVLSTIFAVGGISSIIGSVYAGRAARRFGLGATLMGGYAVYMMTILLVPVARDPLLFAGLMLTLAQLGDGFFTMYMIHENSLRQAITPERSLGRMNATVRVLGGSALLAGSLAGGWIAGEIGLRPTIVVAACVGLLGALWLWLSPLRSVRELADK